jgi:ElaB/YqjD/DUF883 family membrane-anchored ribosome-binding protein
MSTAAHQTVVRLKDFRASEVGDRVSKTLSSIAGQLADGVQNWTSKARSAAKSTDGLVRSNPWAAIGAIALAGAAAGILVSRGARARRRSVDAPVDSPSELAGG